MDAVPEPRSSTDKSIQKHDGSASSVEDGAPYDAAFVRRTLRKVDLRLLPILGALYAFNLIDRSNIGLARVVAAPCAHFARATTRPVPVAALVPSPLSSSSACCCCRRATLCFARAPLGLVPAVVVAAAAAARHPRRKR